MCVDFCHYLFSSWDDVSDKILSPLLDMQIAVQRSILQPFPGLELSHVLVVSTGLRFKS